MASNSSLCSASRDGISYSDWQGRCSALSFSNNGNAFVMNHPHILISFPIVANIKSQLKLSNWWKAVAIDQ